MITNTKILVNSNFGSSLIFSALGGRGKEKKEKPAAKNFVSPSEGEAGGGVWGEFRLARAEAKPRLWRGEAEIAQKSQSENWRRVQDLNLCIPCGIRVFETRAISHSANPPSLAQRIL